jgi:hypothetical protein
MIYDNKATKEKKIESKDAKGGRADSTDSTLIDKMMPVREEVQNASFARKYTLIGRGE